MMRPIAATAVVLLTSGLLTIRAMAPAYAIERGPVCRQPSVVDEISREVRARNYYGTVDPRLVTEQPTTDPSVVRCQVCVLSIPYDTVRFGDRPTGQCVSRAFEVKIVINGFVVRDLR